MTLGFGIILGALLFGPVRRLNHTVHERVNQTAEHVGGVLDLDKNDTGSTIAGIKHRFNSTRHKFGELLETFKGDLFQLDKDKEKVRNVGTKLKPQRSNLLGHLMRFTHGTRTQRLRWARRHKGRSQRVFY